MQTTIAPTITQRLFPKTNHLIRDILFVIGGSLFVAAFAQIRIVLPFTPVPITGQTLAVLLVGASLGKKRAGISMLLYLGLGILGMPVFAGGAQGLAYLTGATGGYLIGFVVAAYVVGWLAEQGLDRDIRTAFLPFLVGEMVIYAIGVIWLAVYVGDMTNALVLGFHPFLVGDALKITLAVLLLPTAWRLVR
ncbi:MAG: biotin transporter BioY [Anaerolineales bacterium]|nr:biotin transporter BioY [Chloroflexota bacterium]MBL6981470.1 biotin transporter BioY [Anaerolineales bacterium]